MTRSSSFRPRARRLPTGRALLLLLLLLPVILLCPPAGHAQRSPHGTLSVTCEQCHSADSWTVLRSPLPFSHASTGFPLRGQHALVRCSGCHTTLKFRGAQTRCADCHEDLHRGELGKQCERCHTPESWLVPDMMQKHRNTRFPLVGAHAAADCRACHRNQFNYDFTRLRTDCYACHAGDFAGAKSPDHRAAGFSTDCSQCHAVNALRWGGDFNHATTAFPLTGAHRTAACTRCHAGSDFRTAPTDCYTCHRQAFAGATNPRHAGFSTGCVTCHSTTGWRPASFDHNTAAFKLTGAHLAVPCAQCHQNGIYTGTPSACYACHQQAFASATNPKHSGLSTDCATCHTTTAWHPALFNHSTTSFALTGAHVSTPCASCHSGGIYTGTPSTCGSSGCHLARYNATTNPPHAGAGFGTDCQTCHSTSAWTPSTFNHTPWFPISAGSKHSPGRWTSCADCHTVASNYKSFSCIDCHEHSNKTRVDQQHAGRANYTYTSTGCYSCHPQGRSK